MDYKLTKTIKEVRSFKATSEGLLYNTKNRRLYLENDLISEEVDISGYTIYNGEPIYIKNDSTIIGQRTFDKSILIDSLTSDFAIFSSDFDVDQLTLVYEIVDVKTSLTITNLGRLPVINTLSTSNGLYFIGFKTHLSCISAISSNPRWVFDVNSNYQSKILKIIGFWQNHIILACSNHILLLVDIDNGEIIHKWQELKGFEAGSFYKDVLPNPSNFVLDNEASKLIGTFDVYYFEIDLITKQISYENIEPELNSHGIISFHSMGNNPFTNDHLILIAHVRDKGMPDIDLNCVLALNRQTRKVDWHYTFKDTTIGPNVPQITDTQLYLRDIGNNLYIFEKQ